MNEDDVALLMTGSGEGVVRIYRNYESGEDVELVSSWRALTDLLPSRRSSGLIAEWQQGRGTMLVGGDVKVIRVWDAPREMCMSVSVLLPYRFVGSNGADFCSVTGYTCSLRILYNQLNIRASRGQRLRGGLRRWCAQDL